jgi:hypothetical protein
MAASTDLQKRAVSPVWRVMGTKEKMTPSRPATTGGLGGVVACAFHADVDMEATGLVHEGFVTSSLQQT